MSAKDMRKARNVPTFASRVAAALAAAIAANAPAAAQERWHYEIMPFLWAAGLNGQTGVGGLTTNVDQSFRDLVEFVDIGGALRLRAHRAPFGWFGEGDYVKLSNDIGTPLGSLRADMSQTMAELGLSYDLTPQLAAYAGTRFQRIDVGLTVRNLGRSSDQKWADGIVGLRWTPALHTRHWVTWVRADVGAGGSRLVWLAEAGGGYRWGSRWGAYLAYRVLHTDYETTGFTYDIRQSGLMLGFGVRF